MAILESKALRRVVAGFLTRTLTNFQLGEPLKIPTHAMSNQNQLIGRGFRVWAGEATNDTLYNFSQLSFRNYVAFAPLLKDQKCQRFLL